MLNIFCYVSFSVACYMWKYENLGEIKYIKICIKKCIIINPKNLQSFIINYKLKDEKKEKQKKLSIAKLSQRKNTLIKEFLI